MVLTSFAALLGCRGDGRGREVNSPPAVLVANEALVVTMGQGKLHGPWEEGPELTFSEHSGSWARPGACLELLPWILNSLLPSSGINHSLSLMKLQVSSEGRDLCRVVLGPTANFCSVIQMRCFLRAESVSVVLFVMNCATRVFAVKNTFLKGVLSKCVNGRNG